MEPQIAAVVIDKKLPRPLAGNGVNIYIYIYFFTYNAQTRS